MPIESREDEILYSSFTKTNGGRWTLDESGKRFLKENGYWRPPGAKGLRLSDSSSQESDTTPPATKYISSPESQTPPPPPATKYIRSPESEATPPGTPPATTPPASKFIESSSSGDSYTTGSSRGSYTTGCSRESYTTGSSRGSDTTGSSRESDTTPPATKYISSGESEAPATLPATTPPATKFIESSSSRESYTTGSSRGSYTTGSSDTTPPATTYIEPGSSPESETPPPATKLKARWSLQYDIFVIFGSSLDAALSRRVPCSISPCSQEDGDYICTSVLEAWPELRKTGRFLGPTDAGLTLRRTVMVRDWHGMIERCFVCGPGFLMFKISMNWIAKSIHKIVKDGMDICAPKLSVERAILYFFSGNIADTGHLRSTVIGETLARILEYSRVAVIRKIPEEGVIKVHAVESEGDEAILSVDLAALWHALNVVKADWILHVTDVGQRDHFEMCISAAKLAGWIVNDRCAYPLSHVGFDLLQADDYERPLEEAKTRCKTILVGQGDADEWTAEELEDTAEALGYGAVKYAVLKNNRLTKCTIDFDEILNEKGNTVVYLHYTHAQVCSIITEYTRDIKKLKKLKGKKVEELTLKNNEERELGLHLLRFTEVLGEVCALLMPHILCEYLYDLCKKFDSFYSCTSEVVGFGDEKGRLLLCAATEQVMRKSFHLLVITPIHEKTGWIKEFVKRGLEIRKQGRLVWPVGDDRAPASHPTGYASAFDSRRLKLLRPGSQLSKRFCFSDLTEQQLTELFSKGPCFRFDLCKAVLRRNIDARVENRSSSRKLILFGIIQAETHISDPSHYGSFSILNRNFDNPLVMTKPGSLSPHDICYCSLSVSTFVKITAKLYGTTYTGDGMESHSEYMEYYPPIIDDEDEDSDLEEEDGKAYLDDDAYDICNGNVLINFSEYFANSPNGSSGYSKLKGKDGYLDLYYVALKYAVEAALEVGFVATSKETKVYGTVMAYYGNNFSYECSASERSLYNAMLFEIKQPSHIEPGKINLMRSALGVPARYSLIIDAELHDFTSGDLILSGVCEFFVPVDGSSSVGFINGKDCSLELKVDWKLPI